MGDLCARCGHRRGSHRRLVWWHRLIGRRACRHRYLLGTLRGMTSVACQCDGWKVT